MIPSMQMELSIKTSDTGRFPLEPISKGVNSSYGMFKALSSLGMHPPEIPTQAHGTIVPGGLAGRRKSGSTTTLDAFHHDLFASNPQQFWQNKENMKKHLLYICNISGYLQR